MTDLQKVNTVIKLMNAVSLRGKQGIILEVDERICVCLSLSFLYLLISPFGF